MTTFTVCTALGTLLVELSPRGIRRLEWAEPGAGAAGRAFPCPPQEIIAALRRYAEGERVSLDFPVDLCDIGGFHREALLAAKEIPWGEARSYGWVAWRARRPAAARAVGQAMARNPVCLVIPCHRVIGSDGRLVGFGGPAGLELKARLLRLEGVSVANGRVVAPDPRPPSPSR